VRNVTPDEMGRGHHERGRKNYPQTLCGAGIVAAALFAAPSASSADERGRLSWSATLPARRSVGSILRRIRPGMQDQASLPRDVVLSAQALKDLQRINLWVNTNVKPMTDMDHWGVVER